MPECPVCFGEMDYDAMMRHDTDRCRRPVRRIVEAALILDAEAGSSTLPPDNDMSRAAWRNLREAVAVLYERRHDV